MMPPEESVSDATIGTSLTIIIDNPSWGKLNLWSSYADNSSFIVQATVTIINYNGKMFIVQATVITIINNNGKMLLV